MATLTELTGEMPADVEPAYHKSKQIACQFFGLDCFIANVRNAPPLCGA